MQIYPIISILISLLVMCQQGSAAATAAKRQGTVT